MAAAPDAASVRAASRADFGAWGYADDADLQRLVDLSAGTLTRWTGQFWTGTVYSNIEPAVGTEAMAFQAIIKLTEVAARQMQPDRADAWGDFDILTTFSAGSYSETRRSGKDAMDAQRAMIGGLLWPLMDYDHRDEWLEMTSGINRPAAEYTDVDWGATQRWEEYGLGAPGNLPPDLWPLPRD